VIMGGFSLYDADKSFLRVLDHEIMIYLYDKEEIEWPTMTEEEIQDRSKADIFSKGIVVLQTTWFIVQCISRFATKLAITELEVVTLAFAACNGITYWLWWHKPSDVRCAVPVYLKTSEPSSSLNVSKARQQRNASKPSNPVEASVEPITQEENDPGFLASIRQSFARRRKKTQSCLHDPLRLCLDPFESRLRSS